MLKRKLEPTEDQKRKDALTQQTKDQERLKELRAEREENDKSKIGQFKRALEEREAYYKDLDPDGEAKKWQEEQNTANKNSMQSAMDKAMAAAEKMEAAMGQFNKKTNNKNH